MTTAGEGGMVTTNDRQLWSRMWSYKDHGKSWEAVYEREHAPGFRWLHESIGTNWRMTEVQGVIGRIQLRRMADWTAARNANAERILATCRAIPALRVPVFRSDTKDGNRGGDEYDSVHAYYKCYVYVRPQQLKEGCSRDSIIEALASKGVPCYQGSCSEVYLEKAFDGLDCRPAAALPSARQLGATSIMFLVHPTLTSEEISKTCIAIRDVMREAQE